MNMSIHSTNVAPQRTQASNAVSPPKLPIYLRLIMIVLTIVVVLTAGWTTLVRQVVAPTNPFFEFAEILPGQPQRSVRAQGFSCSMHTYPVLPNAYCTRAPAAGPFSLIGVIVTDGIVSRVNYSVSPGVLTIGDLALLWGRPNVRMYRQSVNLDWPGMGITASAWAENSRFSNFIPVLSISFGTLTSNYLPSSTG